jgi:putative transposase
MFNENLFDIQECNNCEFDMFVRVFTPMFKEGKKRAKTICLPVKQHRHSLKFKDWNRKKSIQLQRIDGKYFLNFIYEKPDVEKKDNTKKIGIDLGYHKLIADSEGKFYGTKLIDAYKKLAKKKRGSKKYKKLLKFKENEVNRLTKKFVHEHEGYDIVCEDLKNVKHKSSFYRSVNNKLQYWSYRQVIGKLELLSESEGFTLVKVDPSYTSQTCSNCGAVIKANREGERYHCSCGLEIDADTNAAINILRRGAYCPSSQKA